MQYSQWVLPDDVIQSLEAHLKGCESCRGRVRVIEGSGIHHTVATDASLGSTHASQPDAAGGDDSGRDAHGDLERGSSVGRYVIIDKLGAGGMGAVYAAWDPELDRKIALKILRSEFRGGTDSSVWHARLMREAQAMAKLSHPNVVTVHDVGSFGSEVFLGMEFVEGGTLTHWLKQKPRAWREVLDIFARAGRGLAAAHAAGLVHRDFKPDNVMVDSESCPHVTDFGLARAGSEQGGAEPPGVAPAPVEPSVDAGGIKRSEVRISNSGGRLSVNLTTAGALIGTPAYMAAEQFCGGKVDARTDQFNFTVSLYEALYGERPFAGDSARALQVEVTAGRLRAAPAGTKVPTWVRRILLRALSLRPEDRYPSMEALLSELSRDPGVVRRRYLVAAAVLVLTGAGIFAYVDATQAERNRCASIPDKLNTLWDAEQKGYIKKAFLATQKPYAEVAWRGVEPLLDSYAQGWVVRQTQACEATRADSREPDPTALLRMVCLERQLTYFQALSRVFAQADAQVVEKAVQAANALPALQSCDDTNALAAQAAPPQSAADQAKVEQIRVQLAEAKALMDAGRYPRSLEVATVALAAAREVGYRPIEAQALFVMGALHEKKGDFKAAEEMLLLASRAALVGRDDELLARVWTLLVQLVGDRQRRFEQGHHWAELASSILDRLGGNKDLKATLLNFVGNVCFRENKADEALKNFEQSLAFRRELSGEEDPQVAVVLANMGNVYASTERFDQALERYRQAMLIREKVLGPEHPDVALLANNMGNVYASRREYEPALENYQRSLTIREAALGPEHPDVATSLNNLGEMLELQQRYPEALENLQKALAIRRNALGEAHPRVGSTMGKIGQVLTKMNRPEDALSHLKQALEIDEKALGSKHPQVADDLTAIGEAYLLVDAPRAVEPLERAVASRAEGKGEPSAMGRSRFALARALAQIKRGDGRARELASKAREDFLNGGATHTQAVAEIDAWLATRNR